MAVWGLWMLAGRGVRLIIIQQLTLVHDSMMIPDLVQGNIQTHRNSNMYICAHTHMYIYKYLNNMNMLMFILNHTDECKGLK